MLTDQFATAVALYQRALADDDLIVLREAIVLLENTPQADVPLHMGLLIECYQLFLAMTEDLRAADEILDLCHQTVQALGPRHPDRGWFLTAMVSGHVARLRAGSLGDLREVIVLGEEALTARKPRSRSAVYQLVDYSVPLMAEVGEAYEHRFRLAATPKDLDRAIELRSRALFHGRTNDPDLLAGLCRTYLVRFDRDGRKKDLTQAVRTARMLVTLVGAEAAGAYASLLAVRPAKSLEEAWHDLRGRGELDAAIGLGELMIALTGLQIRIDETVVTPDHPIAVPLADAYFERFLRSSVRADIDRAVALTDRSDWQEHAWLVGGIHLARSVASGSGMDLAIAIEAFETILAFDASRMTELAEAYRSAFLMSQDPEYLRRAVDLSTCAITLEPAARHVMVVRASLHRLEGSYDEAIDLYAKASVPSDLASTYLARARDAGDLRRAIEYSQEGSATRCQAYLELWRVSPSEVPPVETLSANGIRANRALGALASSTGRHDLAVRLFDEAVALLRDDVWRDIDWQEQEIRLSAYRGLVPEAIGAHLAVDDPAGAVRIAEQGRAITLGSELDLRIPSDDPDLERIRARLTEPMRLDLVGTFHDNVGRTNRTHLWTQYDLLATAAEPVTAVEDGAVVLINCTAERSDAIIITSSAPVAVSLPRLNLPDVQRFAQSWAGHAETLAWLWESTAGPVLAELATDRVWWLPIGPIGLFPLHAAQIPGQPGALDLVTSSYLPTLSALHHARQRPAVAERKLLTIAMRHTPALPDLPGTVAEATTLRADHELVDATTAEVLDALQDCTWAHFACHATADPDASSRGMLHLRDGALPVEAIGRLGLDKAELAYLSACSSGSRSPYSDEPTNLAAAFHLAGFRHVIASLWPLHDAVAAQAAALFYQRLPTAGQAAQAIRSVCLDLRSVYPDQPGLWAPLIHSGP